ncbi:MAG: TIGR03862 family flavoprotein [Boseongicola sp.]|nr:TIGR03862 family flavoprotein [Boseongicola sp.]MDD9979690.1 TIGR03862 family flavoprotein [Boseongicola sp.]
MVSDDGASKHFGKVDALVVGAGPAGLMAAEVLGRGGASVLVADAMPSVGRKFLMAGKSGLNLTKSESADDFFGSYRDLSPEMIAALKDFGPDDVMRWAEDLGEPLFTGTSGRVFPVAMKASPILRKWLMRLDGLGVERRTKWKWLGWEEDSSRFSTPEGDVVVTPKITVLAMGGGSWARLGSDGAWVDKVEADTVAFQPSNVGLAVDWSPHVCALAGTPVKNTRMVAGGAETRGEWVITNRGMEGGGVYDICREVLDGSQLKIDLVPDFPVSQITEKLKKPRGKESLGNYLRKTLGLGTAQRALLNEWGRPLPDGKELAKLMKALPAEIVGSLPTDEAISTAGGVSWAALDGFELTARKGVFCAGEMLAWDAPTGGYLLNGCLATGRSAGLAALSRLNEL